MRSHVLTIHILLGLLVWVPFTHRNAVQAQTTDRQMQELLRQVETGYHAADPDIVTNAMTDDVILLPSGAGAIRGRHAVRARYETYFRRGGIALTMNPQEIRVGDGWAVIRGAMSGRRANATEESATIVGKFMMIVDRQQDGSWLLSRLIWNDDPEDL
jgi:uncharacterized protein (TIGR02246 family)